MNIDHEPDTMTVHLNWKRGGEDCWGITPIEVKGGKLTEKLVGRNRCC